MVGILNGPAVPAQKVLSREYATKQFEATHYVGAMQANWKRWLLCSTIVAGGYYGQP